MRKTFKTNLNSLKHHLLYVAPLILSPIILSNNAFTIGYQGNAGIEFTFSPTISLNVSGDLSIDELLPGNSADSNIITIDVNTNSLAGYTLTTTVGKKVGTSGVGNADTYLTNTGNNNYKFTSLSSSTPNLSDFSDNTWGYSYCISSNDCTNTTNWISGSLGNTVNGYNGLPLDNNANPQEKGKGGITLLDTNSNTDTEVKFKIGARASTYQPAGQYTNTINFYVVSKPTPISFYDAFAAAGKEQYNGYYTMQDMTSTICSNVYTSQLADNSDTMEAQLLDIRDGNLYWVAKLKDGKCWMTQNLDLDLSTSTPLDSTTTDLTVAGTGAYVDGYTQNSGIIAWTPINSTIDVSNSEVEPTSITGWIDDNNTAYSVNPGNWYETSTYYDSSVCHVDNKTQYCSYITKATSIYEDYFTTDVSETNPHRHLGNYYNWSSAIASNNSSTITDDYTIADNSICPKGWRLPQTIGSAGDFDQLNSIYNSAYSSTNQKDYGIFNAPFYGVRAGNISNNYMYNAGYYGNYETGTAHNDGFEFTLYFRSDNLRPRGMFGRGLGWSVRCLAR